MDKLPPEILPLIFAEIWDLYPESLRSLNTVNRLFYDTAARFLYRTLTIRFQSNQEYKKAVTDVLTLSTEANWHKHTRRVDIVCGQTGLQLSSNCEMVMDQIPFPEDDLHFGPVTGSPTECDGLATLKWELLVSLLGKIQHLVELNYAVVNMFPQALLKALHQHHPQCRLNIHAFPLTSLFPPLFDVCEMDLIQSPCLHGIRFSPWVESEDTGPETLDAESIYRIMSIAPNLKHFCVDFEESDYPLSKPISKGQGLNSSTTAFNMGKLKSLSLRFGQSKQKILHESLDLDYINDYGIPRAIASTYSFRDLQNLSVVLSNSLSNGATEVMSESINPLTCLKIRSTLGPRLIEKILMRHGPTLQGLVLLPGPGYDPLWAGLPKGGCSKQVLRYAKLCPRLRKLHIETQRAAGIVNEAYGQFPSLESLALDMECAIPPEQSTNPGRAEMPAVAEIAFNLTLDPALCLAIWDRIATTQRSGRLRKLKLHPYARRSQPCRTDSKIVGMVLSQKRSYLVRRRIFDKQELPIIVEINAAGCLPLNSVKRPSRRPLWFEALPQVN
ncbi:hypothetical protein N7465_000437 [Penicillium sp. CMV-2018d]|nr:hypothetical protein N7465_000437 [Penicillium sp. CMV-2018d]